MLADLILHATIQKWGIAQQAFILFTTGMALLFLDHAFTPRTWPARKQAAWLVAGGLGLGVLALAFLAPIGFGPRSLRLALPYVMVVIGLLALLGSAYLRLGRLGERRVAAKLLWLIALLGLSLWLSRGLFNYLLLCLTSLFAGRGLLRMLGLPGLNHRSLAPFLALVFWTVLIGFGVGLGIPMRFWSLIMWALTIGLIWHGIRQPDGEPLFAGPDLLMLLLPLLVAFPYTMYGFSNYSGNPSADGWVYTISGRAVWELDRCTPPEAAAPMLQFALNVTCGTRYITFGFLAFLSLLPGYPGDTQMSVAMYVPWIFFVYASGLRFFAESRAAGRRVTQVFAVLGVLAAWPMRLMISNNLDNLLMIAYLPAISGIILLITDFSWRWNVLLGILAAAVLYTYPELAPFVLFAAGLLIVERWLALRLTATKILRASATIVVAGLITTAPYLLAAFKFVTIQLRAVYSPSVGRLVPGGRFASELVDPQYWFIALWGMGGAWPAGVDSRLSEALGMIVGILFLLSFIAGVNVLRRKGEKGLLAVLVFFALCTAYFLIVMDYGYAGYKLLSIAWWLIAYAILSGSLPALGRLDLKTAGRKIGYGALAVVYLFWCYTQAQKLPLLSVRQILPYRELADVEIPDGQTVIVSVTDFQAATWAAYFMRDKDIRYMNPPALLTKYVPDTADPTALRAAYMLVDRTAVQQPLGELVWENSVYKLVSLSNAWFWLEAIETPNALENLDGHFFFWMGGGITTLSLQSEAARNVRIAFEARPGPSLPEIQERHMRIVSGDWNSTIVILPGAVTFLVPVEQGENKITLEILEQPSLLVMPNGDKRPLMLGVLDFSVGE